MNVAKHAQLNAPPISMSAPMRRNLWIRVRVQPSRVRADDAHAQPVALNRGRRSTFDSRDRNSVQIHARCAISRDALYPPSISFGRPPPMMVPAGPRSSGRCMSTGRGIAVACCGRCTCRIFPRFRGKHPPTICQNGGFPAWTSAPMHLPKWLIILPSRARSPQHHLFNKHTCVGTVYCPR